MAAAGGAAVPGRGRSPCGVGSWQVWRRLAGKGDRSARAASGGHGGGCGAARKHGRPCRSRDSGGVAPLNGRGGGSSGRAGWGRS